MGDDVALPEGQPRSWRVVAGGQQVDIFLRGGMYQITCPEGDYVTAAISSESRVRAVFTRHYNAAHPQVRICPWCQEEYKTRSTQPNYCGRHECLSRMRSQAAKKANHTVQANKERPECVEILGTWYLLGVQAVADFCGVNRGTAWAWKVRRAGNGFPESVMSVRHTDGKVRELYDPEEIEKWFQNYVPRKGGGGNPYKNPRQLALPLE